MVYEINMEVFLYGLCSCRGGSAFGALSFGGLIFAVMTVIHQ